MPAVTYNSGIYPFNNGVYFNAANTDGTENSDPSTVLSRQWISGWRESTSWWPGGLGDNLLQNPVILNRQRN